MTVAITLARKAAAAALAASAMLASAAAADLQVEVRGLAGETGTVNVGLFDRAASFPKQTVAGERVPAATKPAVVVFRNLAPGEYAVSAFHDANSNGTLDKNLLGMPTEKYGFSRDAAGNMGPPSFDAAKITFGTENQTIVINLR